MNAYGVDVLHSADCDCMVIRVTHNLKLDLLVSLNALLNKHLMNGRELECIKSDLNKLLLVVCKSAARAAEGKCGTKNYGVTDSLCRFLCFLNAVRDLGGDSGLADRLTKLLEELSVLCSLNTLARRTQKLGVTLLEDSLLFKLHSEIKSRLSADTGHDSVRTLVAEYLRDIFKRQGLHIHLVRNSRVCHNRRGVGVYEYDLISLLLERKTSLRARIVKLCCLADYDRTRADNQNFLQICSLCHIYLHFFLYTSAIKDKYIFCFWLPPGGSCQRS